MKQKTQFLGGGESPTLMSILKIKKNLLKQKKFRF